MYIIRKHPGLVLLLLACLASWSLAAEVIKTSPEKEKEQLAILKSDAPAGEKALACKRLAIDGSAAAVPELAKLLPDPQLSSWARTALEVIPGAEADAALRQKCRICRVGLMILQNSEHTRTQLAMAVDIEIRRILTCDHKHL